MSGSNTTTFEFTSGLFGDTNNPTTAVDLGGILTACQAAQTECDADVVTCDADVVICNAAAASVSASSSTALAAINTAASAAEAALASASAADQAIVAAGVAAAAISASAASTSASAAAGSATTAGNSATASAASASASGTYASLASTSSATASNSATAAAASATLSGVYAGNAAASAAAAAASAAQAGGGGGGPSAPDSAPLLGSNAGGTLQTVSVGAGLALSAGTLAFAGPDNAALLATGPAGQAEAVVLGSSLVSTGGTLNVSASALTAVSGPYFGMVPASGFVRPDVSAFVRTNLFNYSSGVEGQTTISQIAGGPIIASFASDFGNSADMQAISYPLTTDGWEVVMLVEGSGPGGDPWLYLGSAANSYLFWAGMINGTFYVQLWNNPTSYNSTPVSFNGLITSNVRWYKIVSASAAQVAAGTPATSVYISSNGLCWFPVFYTSTSLQNGGAGGINTVGICANNANAENGSPVDICIWHFASTAPNGTS